ncbi:hypothetical protein E9232_003567 [Inquilinus ginsengisoli]|uniref:DUF4403 family protein n=1 Tax=Inquilinus ginsengisoli TaxID=363840 RepID=A0ABU1JQZ0_9PROT|nr:hypothetical protein [Inquilinus ginsengisoli]MDR6291041.1 hypothetical protein [Inquilinus ginsengisoli]
MTRIRRAAAVAVIVAGLVPMAHAAPVPTAPADRCRGLLEIAAAVAGIATPAAATVEPLGADGCRFSELRVDLGLGRSWTVGTLSADGLDFARIYQDRRLEAASLRAKDVQLKDSAVTAALGPGLVKLDAALDYRWDAATGDLDVSSLSLSGPGLGEISFSNRRRNVRAQTFSFDFAPRFPVHVLIGAGDLTAMSLRFRDDGIVDRVLTAGAQGLAEKDPGTNEERKAALQQAVQNQVASMSAGGFPDSMVTPLLAFVRDFPAPRPITLTAAPAGTVSMPALLFGEDAGDATPEALFRRLNLTVTY